MQFAETEALIKFQNSGEFVFNPKSDAIASGRSNDH